jgi:hypothetical protein
VRDALADLKQDGAEAGTPVPPQSAPEAGTPAPPEKERTFRQGRNPRSTESSSNNLQEKYSPSSNPTPTAATGTSPREEETLDSGSQGASSTASPKPVPTPNCRPPSTKKSTPPDGGPWDREPEAQAEPDSAEQARTPVVELSFACLMRDYPHPPGGHGIEHEAYRPHALRRWRMLTAEQKRAAVQAARHAPGKVWLGHWLESGRETGIFEILKQPAAGTRAWVSEGTPQHAAWTEHYRARGRRLPTTQHRIDGELRAGWMFESEWPPNFNPIQRDGGAA